MVASRMCDPTPYGPTDLSSLSRMIAIDQRGSVGAYMTASSLSGNDVRWSGGGGGGPPVSSTLPRIGGQVEQKMFRFRISSTCFE